MSLRKARWTIVRYILAIFSLVIAHSVSAWTVDLDFEKGKPGSRVADIGSGSLTVYSNDVAYGGRQSAKLTATKGKPGFGSWGGIISHPSPLKKGDELWYRVRTFFPTGFILNPNDTSRLKFLRVRTKGSTGKHEGYNDLYIDLPKSRSALAFIFEGEQRWSSIGERSRDLPAFDQWTTYEFYIKFDDVALSNGGDAVVRVWRNGELVKEITDRKTLKTAASVADMAYLFTWFGNTGAPQTQSMWIDDLTLTSDRPSAKDKHGNPFIGMGIPAVASPPTPPLLQVSP